MTSRPILFSAPMVRAILDGRKTVTRRVVKPQPVSVPLTAGQAQAFGPERIFWHRRGVDLALGVPDGHHQFYRDPATQQRFVEDACPYGAPGDRLWLQEGYTLSGHDPHAMTCRYLADSTQREVALTPDEWGKYLARKFTARATPGRFMYRSCSRLTLAVESVRVERLHDITEEDARAEGVTSPDEERPPCPKCKGRGPFSCACRGTGHLLDPAVCPKCLGERLHMAVGANLGVTEVDCADCDTYRKRFRNLWGAINGAESWAANPFVWAIGFSRTGEGAR